MTHTYYNIVSKLKGEVKSSMWSFCRFISNVLEFEILKQTLTHLFNVSIYSYKPNKIVTMISRL